MIGEIIQENPFELLPSKTLQIRDRWSFWLLLICQSFDLFRWGLNFIYLLIHLSIYSSIYLSIHSFIYLFIHLSMYLLIYAYLSFDYEI